MNEKPKPRVSFKFPREVLLVEIERRCDEPSCSAPTRVSLTKDEARDYNGFECERCGRKQADFLTERDVPEWWEELAVTGLAGLRARDGGGGESESGEVVERLSENWRELGEGDGVDSDEGESGGGGRYGT